MADTAASKRAGEFLDRVFPGDCDIHPWQLRGEPVRLYPSDFKYAPEDPREFRANLVA